MDVFTTIFGSGTDLTTWQMASRAVVVFAIALLLIRVSGRRSFGQRSPFDACTTVLLGAVLSRGVVGASPFWATVSAAMALVLMHRVVAWSSVKWEWFENLVSGHERVLVSDGTKDRQALKRSLISDKNLDEAVRKKLGNEDYSRVKRAVLERDGEVSVSVERRR